VAGAVIEAGPPGDTRGMQEERTEWLLLCQRQMSL